MSFTEAQKEGLLNAMRSDPIAVSDVVAEICAELQVDVWQASKLNIDTKEDDQLLSELKNQYFTLEPSQYEQRLGVFDAINTLRGKYQKVLNG